MRFTKMRRHYISSSVIRWYGLDPETGALEIEFVSGTLYRYSGVPRETLVAMEAAPSKGRFFDAHIRERFKTERVR
jgi:lysyl-tRNA synthetase class 2